MHQEVYQEMVKCGVASKLDEEVWFNKACNIVEQEKDAFGLKSQYFLLHPNKVIFLEAIQAKQMMETLEVRCLYALQMVGKQT